jgi:anti-sigma B factor antagonist
MRRCPGEQLPAAVRQQETGSAATQPGQVGSSLQVQNHFRVEVQSTGRAAVITASGELDLTSSAGFDEELQRVLESDLEQLIIDLRQLEFMDSTGLSTLVKAHQRAGERGQRFGVVRGPQQVQRLLSLTGVDERLSFADTPEELLAGS